MKSLKSAAIAALLRLIGISRDLWEFIAPIVADATAALLEQLLPIALDIVRSYAAATMTGEEKRRRAAADIKAAAVRAGLEVSASLVNLAIEQAVQKLKEVR